MENRNILLHPLFLSYKNLISAMADNGLGGQMILSTWESIFSNNWIQLSHDMKNYVDQGGCYVSKPKPEGDNTLLDLHYSSYHTKAELCCYSLKIYPELWKHKIHWFLTLALFFRCCWILDVSFLSRGIIF